MVYDRHQGQKQSGLKPTNQATERQTMNTNQFNQYRMNYQPPREKKESRLDLIKSIVLAIAIGSSLGYLLATHL